MMLSLWGQTFANLVLCNISPIYKECNIGIKIIYCLDVKDTVRYFTVFLPHPVHSMHCFALKSLSTLPQANLIRIIAIKRVLILLLVSTEQIEEAEFIWSGSSTLLFFPVGRVGVARTVFPVPKDFEANSGKKGNLW